MPATIYYDNDADLSLLKGKTIAILGYGSQGHAQAQNLRDSGCNVIIGQRPGGPNYDLAVKHGFKPMSRRRRHQAGRHRQHPAARRSAGRRLSQRHQAEPEAGQHADVLARLQHPLRPGRAAAGRRCAAGRPEGPRPPGPQRVRERRRRALPDRHRPRQPARRRRKLGLAYAKGIGGTRGGVIETTFAEETETDLFGEQVVLCGGVSALVKAGFRDAGRSRLSARDGLLRVHARAEADRRPVLSGRPELHAVQRLEHGRVRRLHPRPADRHRRDQGAK